MFLTRYGTFLTKIGFQRQKNVKRRRPDIGRRTFARKSRTDFRKTAQFVRHRFRRSRKRPGDSFRSGGAVFQLAAIIRGNECIIPGGDDCVKLHDSVIAVTTRFGMQRFADIFEE